MYYDEDRVPFDETDEEPKVSIPENEINEAIV